MHALPTLYRDRKLADGLREGKDLHSATEQQLPFMTGRFRACFSITVVSGWTETVLISNI